MSCQAQMLCVSNPQVNASYDSASQAAVSQPAAPLPARESGEAELGAVMVRCF